MFVYFNFDGIASLEIRFHRLGANWAFLQEIAPSTTMYVIQRGLALLDTGWSVEEAEVAAQDRTIWKIFTNRAASTDNA